MKRKLVFYFDGTWNGRDDKYPTNIRKMFLASRVDDQIPFYFAGPGNEDENSWLGEKIGGAFGWGVGDIRDEALRALVSVYRKYDDIYVFGFSRGAAIARLFCGAIHDNGVNEYYPEINFLGCFDTVAAFAPFGPSQQGMWHDLHVSETVIQARHALALDEDREAFIPNLMNKREGIKEVWFKGVHSDIGGGFESTDLSDISLGWMLDEAKENGLHVPMVLHPNSATAPTKNEGRWRTESRRVGIKVDDEWSDLPAVRYNEKTTATI